MKPLTQRSKSVSNKKMTFMERIYLPAIFGGMWITLKHFFKKKNTVSYPEETRPVAPIYRGQHVLKRDDEGRERCTACGLCAVSCPAKLLPWMLPREKMGMSISTEKRSTQRSTRSICCVAYFADCAKKPVLKKPYF